MDLLILLNESGKFVINLEKFRLDLLILLNERGKFVINLEKFRLDLLILLYGHCNHDARHDSPRSCRDALSKKCQRIHKTGQNKKRSHKKRARDLWYTRRETQIQGYS